MRYYAVAKATGFELGGRSDVGPFAITSRRVTRLRKSSKMAFAIKAEVSDPHASSFKFIAQKSMYGGKKITKA